MSAEPTVFVVDPDIRTREAVQQIAASMELPCEGFESGFSFLNRYDRRHPGCLVLELRVPDVSGPQIQRRLIAEGAVIPAIFLTSHASVRMVVRSMRDGATNFLEKPFCDQELWDTIQEAIACDRKRREEQRRGEEIKSRLDSLTAGERDALGLLIQGRQNREIARRQDVSLRTVELRRAKLMQKLGADSVVQLVHIVLASQRVNGSLAGHSHAVELPPISLAALDTEAL